MTGTSGINNGITATNDIWSNYTFTEWTINFISVFVGVQNFGN